MLRRKAKRSDHQIIIGNARDKEFKEVIAETTVN